MSAAGGAGESSRVAANCAGEARLGKTRESGTFDDFNGLLDPYKLFGLDNHIRDRLASADAHFKSRFLDVSSDVRPQEVTQDPRRTRPLSVSWKTTQTHPPCRCIRPLPAIVSENRSAFEENSPFMLGVCREKAIQAFWWRPPGDECKLDAWFGGSHQRAAAPAGLCLVRFWRRKEAHLYIQVLCIFYSSQECFCEILTRDMVKWPMM